MRLFICSVLGIFFYYCILFYVFFSEKEKRWAESQGQPIDVRWDQNTAFVDGYIPFLTMPLLIMILWGYGLWLHKSKTTRERIALLISIFPVGIVYFIFFIFISMQGYQP
ncbi:hypothetical protein [Domibacillus aminovorans]|uniref:Uncharacterized protein n=1 Tax=Domibacillus aminovorans TaxID=29332 RepID=A0A177L1M4_9BACI|nr:hypothetical protein [Domibacillus aminovorans]OAH59175.1 hypothetical protein AWH49_18685 [Domibacillus aminovorans]